MLASEQEPACRIRTKVHHTKVKSAANLHKPYAKILKLELLSEH